MELARRRGFGAAVVASRICRRVVFVRPTVDFWMRFVRDEPHLLVGEPDHGGRGGVGAGALLGAGFGDGEGELRGWRDVAALGDSVVRVERGVVRSRPPDPAKDTAGLGVVGVGEGASSAA